MLLKRKKKVNEWKKDIATYSNEMAHAFQPVEEPGFKNLGDLNPDSAEIKFLELFWDNELWCTLTENTNKYAGILKGKK